MADLLVAASVVAFIAVFMGFIWLLERVWAPSRASSSASRSSSSSTWGSPCSSLSGS